MRQHLWVGKARYKEYGGLFTGTSPHRSYTRRQSDAGGGRHGSLGPLVVLTGEHTGRSPTDRFTVREPSSEAKVWWGPVNKPWNRSALPLQNRLLAYLQGKDLFVQDCFAGADPSYRLPIRVTTETARHNLFARNMFIQAKAEELASHAPQFMVIDAPNCHIWRYWILTGSSLNPSFG